MGDIGMTTKKPTARKPAQLKIRRAKRNLKVVARQAVLKNEPWYASAAMQLAIRTADQRDKSGTRRQGAAGAMNPTPPKANHARRLGCLPKEKMVHMQP